MESLSNYLIKNTPPSMYYMPNFISHSEEESILQKIPAQRWISLSNRRLQAIPTQLTAKNILLASKLPAWLEKPIIERLNRLKVFEGAPHGINHCLVNEYLPGQGIMPHEDGDAYYPIVATVSLGGTIVLDVTTKNAGTDNEPASRQDEAMSWRVIQEPRSLLITTGSAYVDTLHGIAERDVDRDLTTSSVANWDLLAKPELFEEDGGQNRRTPRISLTLRDVNKVSSAGNRVFGRPKP
ncbi:hypothetical protein AMS68_001044 [Peltaster fructicola]|uniref:Fe2OG dioxygenase domain-containing protein n=1 Tax=Peltaster fructicola TaxID=286661 RepID=A0A6H0XLA2_9PEZI|nr:hypothetical protein AMS68_001044 [Peltaster fructicola]